MASDGNGVFAITGDGPRAGGSTHQPGGLQDSNVVLRATGLAVVDRSAANYYYPSRWDAMDRADADFGSNSPVYLTIPGAPKPGYVAAASKDGHFYLLDAKNLGGMDGHLTDLPFSTGDMSVRTSLSSYATAAGVFVALSTEQGAMCPGGGGSRAVMGISLPVMGTNVRPAVAWCATMANGGPYAPIATTKMVTAVATHTIGHQMLLAVRAAGPLGLRIDGLLVAQAVRATKRSEGSSRRERRARSPFTVADLQLRARGDVRGRTVPPKPR